MCRANHQRTKVDNSTVRRCPDLRVSCWVSPGLDNEDVEGLQTPAMGEGGLGRDSSGTEVFFAVEKRDFYKAP